jgi:hypothetical protein
MNVISFMIQVFWDVNATSSGKNITDVWKDRYGDISEDLNLLEDKCNNHKCHKESLMYLCVVMPHLTRVIYSQNQSN